RRGGGAGGGNVCWGDRRDRPHHAVLRRAAAPVQPGIAAGAAAAGRAAGAAPRDPRPGARSAPAPAGLPVRPALPVRPRPLLAREAVFGVVRRWPPCLPLLEPPALPVALRRWSGPST